MLLVAVAVLIAFASFTVVPPYFGVSAVDSEITARGAATAQQCRFAGPLTRSNHPDGPLQTSWGWMCEAEVRFDDGRTEQVETQYSRLTDADVGRPVRVVERLQAASKSQDRSVIYRADFEPRPVLGGASMLGTVLLALFVGLLPLQRLVRRARGKPADPDD
ncbi:hypothetical protein GCM10027563_38110 [Parasphingorhabdus pacifica]